MPADPQVTLISVFNPDGSSVMFEVVETPLDVEIEVNGYVDASVADAIHTVVRTFCFLVPESTSKWHLFKAAAALGREKAQLEDRMTAPPATNTDELPF